MLPTMGFCHIRFCLLATNLDQQLSKTLFFILYSHPHTVPEFTISPRNVTVSEDASEVIICVSMDSGVGISRNVVVTAQTGAKIGADDQATGRESLYFQHLIV